MQSTFESEPQIEQSATAHSESERRSTWSRSTALLRTSGCTAKSFTSTPPASSERNAPPRTTQVSPRLLLSSSHQPSNSNARARVESERQSVSFSDVLFARGENPHQYEVESGRLLWYPLTQTRETSTLHGILAYI